MYSNARSEQHRIYFCFPNSCCLQLEPGGRAVFESIAVPHGHTQVADAKLGLPGFAPFETTEATGMKHRWAWWSRDECANLVGFAE